MKVIHVNLARGLGGGEFQTLCLMRELRARGVRQKLIARSDKPLAGIASQEGFYVRSTAASIGSLLSIKQKRENVLVHAHDGRGAHRAGFFSLVWRAPYVVTRRILKPPSSSLWTRSLYRRADRLTAVSAAVSSSLTQWQPSLSIQVVGDALVDVPVNNKNVGLLREAAGSQIIVVQVGRLSAEKGCDTTLHIARAAKSRALPLTFWVVGDGPERERLQASASDLDNVIFHGYRENIGDYLSAADILLHPADSEAFGSVLLQAMQSKTPIVASDVGGIPEVTNHGRAGVLIPLRNITGFVDALADLSENPGRRDELVSAGCERVAHFSAANMADSYLSIYQECLARKNCRDLSGF